MRSVRCEGCEGCESEVRGCKSEVVDTGWGKGYDKFEGKLVFFPVRIIFT